MHQLPNVAPNRYRNPDDRRIHRRERLCVPALLDLGSSWLKVICSDISAGGLRVEGEDLPVGSEVEVYVELPSRVAVEAKARVVRGGDRGVALRFIDLGQDARLAITAFCRTSGLRRRISGTFQLATPDTVVFS
jgi:hypothetical protein